MSQVCGIISSPLPQALRNVHVAIIMKNELGLT